MEELKIELNDSQDCFKIVCKKCESKDVMLFSQIGVTKEGVLEGVEMKTKRAYFLGCRSCKTIAPLGIFDIS